MTAIDNFLVNSRKRTRDAIDRNNDRTTPLLIILEEIHSVLTVIAQNMPCNVEANRLDTSTKKLP